MWNGDFYGDFICPFCVPVIYVVTFCVPVIYVVTILVTTIITILRLRKMAAWREQTSSASGSGGSKDVTLTRMLVGCSILFISCNVPPLIFHAALPFVPELSLSGLYSYLSILK